MFRETLLESSPCSRRRKPWPMALAFLLEMGAACVIVFVPLLSTGIIPVSAHEPIIAPLQPVNLASTPPNPHPSQGAEGAHRSILVVTINDPNAIHIGHARPSSVESSTLLPPDVKAGPGGGGPPGDLVGGGNVLPPAPPSPRKPWPISEMSEAMLLHKVEPVYPHIAQVAGISGSVKLHAIIGKDGSIQSLSLISGQPILAAAALEAVQKWRYRPYVLNGVAVEVETFITVNFRKAGQ